MTATPHWRLDAFRKRSELRSERPLSRRPFHERAQLKAARRLPFQLRIGLRVGRLGDRGEHTNCEWKRPRRISVNKQCARSARRRELFRARSSPRRWRRRRTAAAARRQRRVLLLPLLAAIDDSAVLPCR